MPIAGMFRKVIPRHPLSINNNLLLLIRPQRNGRRPAATLGDLNIRRRLVSTRPQENVISSNSSVHSGLNRSIWSSLRTRTATGRRDVDVFALRGADEEGEGGGGELEDRVLRHDVVVRPELRWEVLQRKSVETVYPPSFCSRDVKDALFLAIRARREGLSHTDERYGDVPPNKPNSL